MTKYFYIKLQNKISLIGKIPIKYTKFYNKNKAHLSESLITYKLTISIYSLSQ